MPRTRQQQSAPKTARITRANARMHAAVNPSDVNLMSLPTECLVEVLRFLDIHELLVSAWTCHRLFDVAQDDTLWDRTHFSTANWADALRSHFEADPKAFEDHTGIWTRCKCLLTKVRFAAIRAACENAPAQRNVGASSLPLACHRIQRCEPRAAPHALSC